MSFKTIPDPIFYMIRDYINHNEYRNLMNTNRTRPFQEIKQKTIIFKFTPYYVYLYLTDESFRNHVLNLITNPRKISNKFMIADLPQLEEVCLSYCSGVITLRDLPNLRKLTLHRVKLDLTASIILEKSILAQITHLNLSDGNPNLYTTEYLHDFFFLLENIQSFVFHYHDGIVDLSKNLGKKFLPKLKEIVISSVPNLSINLGLFPQISKLEISGWTLLDKNKTIGNIQLFMESSSFSLSSSSSSTVLSSYSLNSPVLKTLILKNCRRVEVNENFLNYLKQNINQTSSSSSLYSIQLLDCEISSPLVLHCPKLYLQNSADFDSLLSEYCIPEQDQESSLQMKKDRNRIIALVDGSLTNVLSHSLFFQNIQILFLHQIKGLISLDGLEGIPRLIIDGCPQFEFLYPSTTTIDKIQHESIVLTYIRLLKDISCLRNVPRVSIGNCPLVRDFRCFLDSSCSYQLIEYTPFNLTDAKWFQLEQEHESAWEKRLSSFLGYEELEARGKIMPYRNYPKYFPELAPSYSDLPKEVEFPF